MENSSRTTTVLDFHLPHPVYRTPPYAYTYTIRRRRGRVPRPRKPFTHFKQDCILQGIVLMIEGNRYRRKRVIRAMWNRISYELKRPWILMSDQDIRLINLVYGNGRTLFRSAIRHRASAAQTEHRYRSYDAFLGDATLIHRRNALGHRGRASPPRAGRHNNNGGPYDNIGSFSDALNATTMPIAVRPMNKFSQTLGFRENVQFDNSGVERCCLNQQVGHCTCPSLASPADRGVKEISVDDLQVELPFLEAHRRRYSTPERATYYEPYTMRPS